MKRTDVTSTRIHLLCGILLLGSTLQAAESPWLLGDWGGKRPDLAAQGLDFEFLLTLEGVQNLRGGLARSSRALLNLDLIMDVQSQLLGLPENGLLHTYILANYGGKPSAEMIGDFQVASNIEAPDDIKLYAFYWEQGHLDNSLSWLVGLHDYNSKFNALDTASLFFNSSFGISPDISQVGPSIFPKTSLAAILSYLPLESAYLQAGIYDGVPGHPRRRGTHIIIGEDDGLFASAEGGYHNPASGTKLGLGGWYRTTDYTAETNGNLYTNNGGVYLIGETRFGEHWGSFIQLGHADPRRNIVGHYLGLGATRQGLLTEADAAGLALACAFSSDEYRSSTPGADDHELVVEATYEFQALGWLRIQPDLQYIKNPGLDGTLADAVVASLRAYIEF